MKIIFKKIYLITVHIFALAGLILVVGYFGVKYGLTNTTGIIDTQTENFYQATIDTPIDNEPDNYIQAVWAQTEEWQIFATAVVKDKELLKQIQDNTNISARLLMAITAVEQLRLFTSEREMYKQFFYPLKILGNMTQFSWGIMGIKPETATAIEQHLKDSSSDFYLGTAWQNTLNYPAETVDLNQARYTRLTNSKDRYYNYLYGALYLKQIIAQWQKYEVDISKQPAILGTLYNIGFNNSKPKTNPQVGGSKIDLAGESFSFGGLVHQIYWSDELLAEFAR